MAALSADGIDNPYKTLASPRTILTGPPLWQPTFLNDKVLPFYDEHGMNVLRIPFNCGPKYCGRTDTHSYELFLHLNGVEHTKTKPRHPQTNGCIERLNQTVQEEFYKVAFHKKLYKKLEEIQTDLYALTVWYNSERTNQGRYCQGPPLQTFLDGMELYQQYVT